MLDLNSHALKIRKYSQSGEEGIVEAFVNLVYTEDEKSMLSVCEFGSHDGSNSNLLKMLEGGSYSGVFIECDSTRIETFVRNYGHLSNIKIIQDRVGWDEGTDLAAIFRRNTLEIGSLNILSIDIDGDDIHVFQSLKETIDLVLIEYNPTFGFDTEFINPKGRNIGSSPLALNRIADTKNLYLAAITETNLVFVNNKFTNKIKKYELRDVSPLKGSLRYAMGYDGTLVVIDGNGIDLTDEVLGIGWSRGFFVQPLPKILRKFGRLDKSRVVYSLFLLLLTRPLSVCALYRKYQKYRLSKITVR